MEGAAGSWQRFTLEVPAGSTHLSVSTTGGTGDGDLYVRFNAQPETAQGQYDCRPFLSSNNEACDFDNPQAGTWHIGFHGYAAYTGVTLEGSWTPAQTTGGDTLQETVTGESGSWTFFKIEVPEGALSLTVELFEGTGDADLYVRFGEQPTKDTFDCRPFLTGNNETCTIDNPQAGVYHIGIQGFEAYADAMLNAFWTAGEPPPPPEQDEFAQARQACVDRINAFRATLNLMPLERWADNEPCTDQQSEQDALSGVAHGTFGMCNEFGQNTCPGWPSTDAIITNCLQQMWDEGPPPVQPCEGQCFQDHGHFINMSREDFTMVSCGFFRLPDGNIWSNQNFR